MKQQLGFIPLFILAFVLFASVAGGAVIVMRHNQQKQNTAVVANRPSGTTTNISTPPKVTYLVPDGWQEFANDGKFPFIAYPKEYGKLISPASGGRYFDGVLISSVPAAPSFVGVSGAIEYSRYTDDMPVISSRKYGPDIQLVNSVWKVVKSYDDAAATHQYKVGDTYTEVKEDSSQSNVKFYILRSGDEGVIRDTVAFVFNKRMYTIAFPSLSLGTYGSQTTEAQTASRTVAYDHLVGNVAYSINALTK